MKRDISCIVEYKKEDVVRGFRLALDWEINDIDPLEPVPFYRTFYFLKLFYLQAHWFRAGKKQFREQEKYRQVRHLRITFKGISLNITGEEEFFSWEEFEKVKWNSEVIILKYRYAEDIAIIPVRCIKKGDQRELVSLLKEVFKL